MTKSKKTYTLLTLILIFAVMFVSVLSGCDTTDKNDDPDPAAQTTPAPEDDETPADTETPTDTETPADAGNPAAGKSEWQFGDEGYPVAMYGTPEINVEEIDGVWDNAQKLNLFLGTDYGKVSAYGKVMWDDNYLYILVDVKDDDFVTDREEFHHNDSVDIFFSEYYDPPEEETQWRVAEGETHIGVKPDGENFDYAIKNRHDHALRSEIVSEGKYTEDGYIIVLKTAWDLLEPEEGHILGIDLKIRDIDGSPITLFDETLDQSWRDKYHWGKIELVK